MLPPPNPNSSSHGKASAEEVQGKVEKGALPSHHRLRSAPPQHHSRDMRGHWIPMAFAPVVFVNSCARQVLNTLRSDLLHFTCLHCRGVDHGTRYNNVCV